VFLNRDDDHPELQQIMIRISQWSRLLII